MPRTVGGEDDRVVLLPVVSAAARDELLSCWCASAGAADFIADQIPVILSACPTTCARWAPPMSNCATRACCGRERIRCGWTRVAFGVSKRPTAGASLPKPLF